MEFLLLLLLLTTSFFIGIKQKKYTLMLFSSIWMVVFASIGMDRFTAFKTTTLECMYLMIVTNILGLVISKYNFVFSDKYLPKLGFSIDEINFKVLKSSLLICTLILITYFLITLFKAGGLDLNVIRNLNSSTSDSSAFNSYLDTFLFFMLAMPLTTANSLIIIYSKVTGQVLPKSLGYIFLFDCILYLITSAGRIFVIILICFVLSAIFMFRKKLNLLKIFLYGIFVFAILEIMTISRNINNIGFFEQSIQYIVCSIFHMDMQIDSVDLYKFYDVNFGFFTYGGFLYYPIKLLNILFSFNIKVPGEYLEYLQIVKIIEFNGNSVYYNALVPDAFYYYFDSGLLGVFIFSFISSYLIGRYEEKCIYNFTFLNYAYFAIGIYSLIFSPMGSQAWKPYIPMTIIWIYILSKYVCIYKIR